MTLFLAGILLFFATHLGMALSRDLRDALIQSLGEIGYKAFYSFSSVSGIILIIIGWREADTSVLYVLPAFTRHITYLLVWIAFVLWAAAYLPTGKIAAAAKHPMVAGVKIWAFAHLLVNGDVRSVILFGAFLVFGVVDRIALKKRGVVGPSAGRVQNDVIALVLGTALYLLVAFVLHRYIAGVPLR